VVEAEVPHACVHHPVRAEGKHGSDDCAGDNVIPVVIFVDGQGSRNQSGTKDWRVESGEFPHVWGIVGEDLQLGVKVEVKEDKTGNLKNVNANGT
jgi:hypothetical protein